MILLIIILLIIKLIINYNLNYYCWPNSIAQSHSREVNISSCTQTLIILHNSPYVPNFIQINPGQSVSFSLRSVLISSSTPSSSIWPIFFRLYQQFLLHASLSHHACHPSLSSFIKESTPVIMPSYWQN
jgi:hypothetical protein